MILESAYDLLIIERRRKYVFALTVKHASSNLIHLIAQQMMD